MKRVLAGVCLMLLVLSMASGCIRIDLGETVDLTGEKTTFTVRPDTAEDAYKIVIEDMFLLGSAELTVMPSEEPRVEVECKEALLDYGLEAVFDGDTLTVHTKYPRLKFRDGEVKIAIYANYREIVLAGGYDLYLDGTGRKDIALDVRGAVNCVMENLETDALAVDLSGAGKIRMSGTAALLDIRVSGAAKVDAEALTATEAQINISGAGTVELTVTDTLDAGISGAGTVRYHGDPVHVNARVSGAGSVKPVA